MQRTVIAEAIDNGDRHLARRLIGRSDEVAVLRGLLRAPGHGVVTIHGPGGIGKSALARAAVSALHQDFPAGVRAVDLQQPGGSELPCPGWDSGRALLVLDGADDAGAAVLDALARGAAATGSRVLAVAVRPLGIPGERLLGVGPLRLPPPGAPPEQIWQSAACALFLAVCGAVGPVDERIDPSLAAIACRIAGGWPLAIELAAARTRSMSMAALVAALREDPSLLLAPAIDPRAPGRYLPSMRAALARTWQRLTPIERAMLRASALFAGPATARQLSTVGDLPPGSAMQAASGLADLHLVSHVTGPPGLPDRVAPLPLVVAVAETTFDRHHPRQPAARRHAEMVCGVARTAARLLAKGDELSAIAMMRQVDPELTGALAQLVANGQWAPALQLAGDIAPMAARTGHFHQIADQIDALLRHDGLPDCPGRAMALVGWATLAFAGVRGQDLRHQAETRLFLGLALARRDRNPLVLLQCLSAICLAWPVVHDQPWAAAAVTEGRSLAQQEGNPFWQARFEAWAGMLAHQRGDADGAATLGIRALARGRRCGDRRARLLAGILLRTLPNPVDGVPGGVPSPAELLVLARELDEPALESLVLVMLAADAAARGQLAGAAHWCGAALERVGSADTWIESGFAVMYLVIVAAAAGWPERAALLHGTVIHRLDALTADMPPHAADAYRTVVGTIAEALGGPAFERLVRLGAIQTWPQATGTALAVARDLSGADPSAAGAVGAVGAVSAAGAVGAAVGPAHGERGDAAAAHGDAATERGDAATGCDRHGCEFDRLTARERQVLALISQGHDTKAIAGRLRVSANSVGHHTSSLLAKLGLSNRTQAAIWALRHELGGHPGGSTGSAQAG